MASCRSAAEQKTAYGSERSLSTDLFSYFIHRSFELNRTWLWKEKLGLFGLYCPAVDGYVWILNSKQQQIQNDWTIKSAPTRIHTGPITSFHADPGNKCRNFIFKDEWSLVWCLFSIFRFPDLSCFWKLIHPCCEIKPSQRFLKSVVEKKHPYTREHRCSQLYRYVISPVLNHKRMSPSLSSTHFNGNDLISLKTTLTGLIGTLKTPKSSRGCVWKAWRNRQTWHEEATWYRHEIPLLYFRQALSGALEPWNLGMHPA